MKILHLETGRHLYGGALQVVYLTRGLSERRVENLLACPTGSEIARAAAQGATIRQIPVGGDLDLLLPFRLCRLIRDYRPDLVHVHSRRGADLWGGIAASLMGVPAVISRRVDNPESPWLAGFKYGKYQRIITISQAIRDVLVRQGVDPDKVECVHSAVDIEAFTVPADDSWFRAEFGFAPDDIVAAVIAQLIPRKGHRFLLEALPEILRSCPNAKILFLGQGPIRAELETYTREQGLDRHVVFGGFRKDLARILPSLRLIIHPATMEGLGVSLLQASAAGVPIVGARSGGIPEIVHHGVNGWLVEPGDVAGLVSPVSQLLSDEGLARQMGNAGKELVRQRFSINAMVEGNLRVYRKVLGLPPDPDSRRG